jgi:hypothetical protein
MVRYAISLLIIWGTGLSGCGKDPNPKDFKLICERLEKAFTCGSNSELLMFECIENLKKSKSEKDDVAKVEQKIACLAKEPDYCKSLKSTDINDRLLVIITVNKCEINVRHLDHIASRRN